MLMKREGRLVSKMHSEINLGIWQALNWLTGAETIPLACFARSYKMNSRQPDDSPRSYQTQEGHELA